MKSLPVRWTLVSVATLAVVLIFSVVSKPSSPVDKVVYIGAEKVPHVLSAADLEIQDSLVGRFTSFNQFAEMSGAEQELLISVANATWYKDGVVCGYSIDRRGRGGLASDASSPILVDASDGRLVANSVSYH